MNDLREPMPAPVQLPAQSLPFVTIVMPIRNERAHVEACIASALASDYPADRFEILAVDGMSDDGTRAILARLAAGHPQLRLLDNPDRMPAFALNLGLAAATGDVIVRLDAHALYPPTYVRRCVTRLLASGAANVGGLCRTMPGAATPTAAAIATALSHPFGVGNARFRIGATAPVAVDTVPFGCWRRLDLVAAGGFRTDLPYGEDDELNARLRRQGGLVLLDPAISATYFARPTTRRLATMLYRYGYHKPFTARALGHVPTLRQLMPPAFVATLAALAVAGIAWPAAWWLLAGLIVAHGLAGLAGGRSAGSFWIMSRLPLIFLLMHIVYGSAYLRGVFDLLTRGWPRAPAGGGG